LKYVYSLVAGDIFNVIFTVICSIDFTCMFMCRFIMVCWINITYIN
jgi:hypothetical protein